MGYDEIDLFGPNARVHHVGMEVRSIQAIKPGLDMTHVPAQKVRVALLVAHGMTIELIEPAAEDSPINSSLSRGIRLAHICYSVPDIESAIACAKSSGLALVGKPTPAPAFENRRIAWLVSASLGRFGTSRRGTSFVTARCVARERAARYN